MTDREQHIAGIIAAVVVHVAVVGAVWGGSKIELGRLEKRAAVEEPPRMIEAGLARRAKSTKGKKSKQPQKEVATKAKPGDVTVSKDEKQDPKDPKDKKKPEPEIDPEAAMAKARKLGGQGEPNNQGDENKDDPEEQTGNEDGHDYGTLDEARGDKYLAELVGRMTVNPELTVPATVREGQNLETWGCVWLKGDGSIARVALDPEHKSPSAAFNSAVLERLKLTTDMDGPVPAQHRKWLMQEGACFPYRY